MDFQICHNNCTNSAIEQLEYLKYLIEEVLSCAIQPRETYFQLAPNLIAELRKAAC